VEINALVVIGVILWLLVALVTLPLFLKWPWLAVFLPWVIPMFKMYLLVHVPITRALDISVLIFGFLGIFLLVGLALRKLRWDSRLTILLLVHLATSAVLAITYSWTTAPHYGARKLFLFAVFNTICFVLGASAIRSTADARKLAKLFSIVVLFVGLSLLVSPSYMYGEKWEIRQTFAETNPLNIAFVIGVGGVAALIWFKNKKLLLFVGAIIWAVALLATYKTGSRAMLAQIPFGAVLLALIYKGSHRALRFLSVALMVIAGFAALFAAADTHGRVFGTLKDPAYFIQQSQRPYLWSKALEGIPDAPFLGHGVGAFAMDVKGEDARHFPHNFFLEVLYEAGIVGFVLFTFFWVLIAYYLWRGRSFNSRIADSETEYVEELWIAIFIAAVMASVLHFDISGQRLLWLLAGVALAVTRACYEEAVVQWQSVNESGYEQKHSEPDMRVEAKYGSA